MFSKPNETFNVGDIVVWGSLTYLVIDINEDQQIQTKGKIQLCNNILSFYSTTDSIPTLFQIPCTIGKATISQDENKYISLPADENIVTCPNIIDSLKITENTRFILSGDAYSVVGINKIENPGLLTIRIKEDQITPDDNIELGIANYFSNQHVYTVDIQNSDVTLNVNDTITLNIICTDNNQQVISPTLSYQSSNINVATVSNGVVTCLVEGTTIITATYNGVSDSINLTVQSAVIPDSYTVSITGANTVKLNSNINLLANIFNNGVVDASKSVIWSVSNQDSSNNVYVSIVSQDGSNITLKATNNSSYVGKYVVVRASKNDDVLVFYDHTIQIKSLF